MKRWLQRFVIFLLIAGLILGSLGWATSEALRMEENQAEIQAQKERAEKLRRALWRLDGMISPALAQENSRPFAHFSALHIPVPAMTPRGEPFSPGTVRVPSPLMDTDLPPWMLLHFQFTPDNKEPHRWQSPQVLDLHLRELLQKEPFHLGLANVTTGREQLLAQLQRRTLGNSILAEARKQAKTAQSESVANFKNDNNSIPTGNIGAEQQQANGEPQGNLNGQYGRGVSQQQDGERRIRNEATNSQRYATKSGKEADPSQAWDSITMPRNMTCDVGDVLVSSMTAMWFPSPEKPDYLMYVRFARFGQKEIVQGIVMDWPVLREQLQKLVVDLFPSANLVPLPDGIDPDAEGVMTALPVMVDVGAAGDVPAAGWSALRIGLAVAWAAVLLALVAMGLSGWSLIDLSERRVRFVSAVTHELRTPLTTLRLYLDMLTSGLVRDETQRSEYLNTLNGESERLHRLISNVLDFARLEKQSAKPTPKTTSTGELLDQLRDTWGGRCEAAGKSLTITGDLPPDTRIHTDIVLAQQILGNLIDNACKYSKGAPDNRVFIRAIPAGIDRVAFEVEDCGQGVSRREWRSIFRPFRRGRGADTTAGGVGLGLALANRWARMLGGKLRLCRGQHGNGACFRVELPRECR